MADNVAITAGSGTSVATDDVAGVHFQRVKLVDGTLDATTAIAAGNGTNGGALRVTVASDSTGVLGLAAGSNNIGDVDVLTIAAGDNNIGNVDIATVPADPFGANADAASATGSISAKLRFIAATGIPVTGTVTVGSHAVTNAGTFAVQDSEKVADDATFTPATTKVQPAGFFADETATDLVDEGDVGAARMTLDRKQIVVLGDIAAAQVIGGGTQTGTADQSIMAASGSASVYNYLCWVAVYNASSTNTYVSVKDGSTVRLVLPLPAYGGAVFNLPYPIKGTGNTAWNLAAGTSVTTAYLYGGGYKGA